MPIQVQLRGGTSEEHNNFVGAEREITVDTTKHTLVVHDGVIEGGYPLPTSEDLSDVQQALEDKIENISIPEQNLDDRYAQKEHEHSNYVKKTNSDYSGMLLRFLGSYVGMLNENGSDIEYIRTTKSGLLPYSVGISSNIGTNSWRFSKGYFDNLDSNNLSTKNVSCTSFKIGTTEIFIGSEFPSTAKENDILIQV